MSQWEKSRIVLPISKNKIIHFHNYAYKKGSPRIRKVLIKYIKTSL